MRVRGSVMTAVTVAASFATVVTAGVPASAATAAPSWGTSHWRQRPLSTSVTSGHEVRLTALRGDVAVTVLPGSRCALWLRGPEQSFELTSGTYRFPVAVGSRLTVSGWCPGTSGTSEVTVLDVRVHRGGVQSLSPASWWRG